PPGTRTRPPPRGIAPETAPASPRARASSRNPAAPFPFSACPAPAWTGSRRHAELGSRVEHMHLLQLDRDLEPAAGLRHAVRPELAEQHFLADAPVHDDLVSQRLDELDLQGKRGRGSPSSLARVDDVLGP